MSGAPFDKKKEDADVPFEMEGELPDFLAAIPTKNSTDKMDNAVTTDEATPTIPDFTMEDESLESFENVGDGADDPPDLSGEPAQPEPPTSLFTQPESPDMVAASAPDVSNITPAPPLPDFDTELPSDVASLVLPGTESMEVYTSEGIHMPEHEINIPAPQFPPVAEAPPAMVEPVPSPPSVEMPPPTEIPPNTPFSAPAQPAPSVFETIPEPVPLVAQPITSPPPQPSISPFPPAQTVVHSPQPPEVSPSPAPQPPISQTMSRLRWVVRTFMATGRLKTRLRSSSKENEPPQSPPSQLSSTPMASPVPQPNESAKQVYEHINEIDSVLESLSNVVSSMDSRIDTFNSVSSTPPPPPIAEINPDTVKNIVNGILSEKLSSINAFADNVACEVSTLKESMASLRSVTESNCSMLVEVSNIQSTISDIQMAISEKMDEFGNLAEINTEDISEISTQIKVTSESLESLSSTVTMLLDEVSATSSTTAEIEEIIGRLQVDKVSVDELSEFMESIHQQIQEIASSASVVGNVKAIDILSRTPAVKLLVIKNEQPFVKLCMEWLEFLLELVGNSNLPDILEYYAGIGWISDDVRLELILMARGMDNYTEREDWKLHPDDHLKSLWFIEQLCGVKVDRFAMQQIDRDVSKMKGGLDTLYNI